MNPEFIALSIVILIFSVIVHEVMHGFVALKFGDRTAEKMGRLTLNPIPHIDPIGSILLPAILLLPTFLTGAPPGFLIAWAKPVPVNPLNFSNLRTGELMVSLAGILSNLALAIIAAILYHIFSLFGGGSNYLVQGVLVFAVNINIMLAVFNLVPIPPLDGSKVLLSQLPYDLAKKYQRIEPYGFMILIALLYTGILSIIISPIIGIIRSILLPGS